MTTIINNNQQTAPSRSLLLENRKIRTLKPTSQTNCCLILLIQRLFFAILNWLYPFERAPYVAIVNALDSHSNHLPNLDREYLCAYFRRFVHEDNAASPNLKPCVDNLQEQYRGIKDYKNKNRSDLSPKDRAKFNALLNGWINKVQQLKEGEQSLIVASEAQGDELFYLFSRKEGHTHLKLIGRGETVSQLNKTEDELIASVDYGVVDNAFIDQLIRKLSPLGENEASKTNLGTVLKDVAAKNTSQVKRKRQVTLDLFFTVFKHIETNSGKTPAECARLELRAEIFTLFGLLKDMRQRFSVAPYEVQALAHMLRLCSQYLYRAFTD